MYKYKIILKKKKLFFFFFILNKFVPVLKTTAYFKTRDLKRRVPII
jgi:hypothetical protein